MGEIRCVGRAASPGVAIGSLYLLQTVIGARQAAGGPSEEAAALLDAVETAKLELAALIAGTANEAADILAFQVAMLEHEELAAPAREEIAAGAAADSSWRKALDVQISDFATSPDEYFRARAADLSDIRDRVLQHLTGGTIQGVPKGAVIAGEDITPSRFLSHDWRAGGAIALAKGSPSSHVAMLARARHVPMVVGVDFDRTQLRPGTPAIVDGEAGIIILEPEEKSRHAAGRRIAQRSQAESDAAHFVKQPATTADGTAVAVLKIGRAHV